VEVLARSAFLSERLAAHPLLLDELLDTRSSHALPGRNDILARCHQCLQGGDDDESALYQLNEIRQQLSFRIALAVLDQRLPPAVATCYLAWLAEAVVDVVLHLARRQLETAHGTLPGARFLIVGYGSLGGEELGFGSDLDLVFLYAAPPEVQSAGPRPLDAARWHARLAQKIIALLGSVTGAGRLYDIDMRLRPDGNQAILVSTMQGYAHYQSERAWTFEHQALVRARPVAGDDALADEFAAIRSAILTRMREPGTVRREVAEMRLKMRQALDRSTPDLFDLKQGAGGLIDLEFILQALVLSHACQHLDLLPPRASAGLLEALQAAGVLPVETAQALAHSHRLLLASSLACTLDRRPRQVPYDHALNHARDVVCAAWREYLGAGRS